MSLPPKLYPMVKLLMVTLFSFKDLDKTSIRKVLLMNLMYTLTYLLSCKNISSGHIAKEQETNLSANNPTKMQIWVSTSSHA